MPYLASRHVLIVTHVWVLTSARNPETHIGVLSTSDGQSAEPLSHFTTAKNHQLRSDQIRPVLYSDPLHRDQPAT